MKNSSTIKDEVKNKYTAIAGQEGAKGGSCCDTVLCCGENDSNVSFVSGYETLEGYVPDADLGLGCGLPTAFARINEGDTVIDLGSGAGNDCFVARKRVGEKGKVIGIDFTEAMIQKAKENAAKLNFNNVEFRFGDIEDIPVASEYAEVVISNCVLNLVPDKGRVFGEIFRVLKPGGHFSISDIVLEREIPEDWKQISELYAGCITGAIQKKDYLEGIEKAGFTNIKIEKDAGVDIPDSWLSKYLNEEELKNYKSAPVISSITVYAEKSSKDQRKCCGPSDACCD